MDLTVRDLFESSVQLRRTQAPVVGQQHGHGDKRRPKLVSFMIIMRNSGCFYAFQRVEQDVFVHFVGINERKSGVSLSHKNSQ